MKSFFDDKFIHTDAARNCDREARLAMDPIFAKWMAEGYSPREIAHIIASCAWESECWAVIDGRKETTNDTGKSTRDP
jgi:hypothetical protein